MMDYFQVEPPIRQAAEQAQAQCKPGFDAIEKTIERNQQKMLYSFTKNRVSETHFVPTTGYGYGDRGRETLDRVLADAWGAEDAMIRHNFVSGTHALTVALFGVLRPGDRVLCVTGLPYDTLHNVVGLGENNNGSLAEFGIQFDVLALSAEGKIDQNHMCEKLRTGNYKMIYIQRSRGYTLRPSISVREISFTAEKACEINKKIIVMVDNCYGEFVETIEPTQAGADLIAGSLIKNPGGGIASTGGYIAGKENLVAQCAYRLTTPGSGREIACTGFHNRELFMGLFNAPHVTGEALKTAEFTAALFGCLGFETSPGVGELRTDIITSIKLGTPEALIAFCRGIQRGAPVDSFVTPEPWDMPGYENQVIMAAGAFTMGASIELSADAPLREPYAVWVQGGLNFHSAKIGVLLAAQALFDGGFIH